MAMPTAVKPRDRASCLMASARDMADRRLSGVPPWKVHDHDRNPSMRIAVESDDELNGALSRAATAAGPGDLGFPIGLLLVEAAKGLAAFGDRRPRFVGAWRMGDKTAGRNRDLAHVRGLPLGHAKATGLLSCGGKVRRKLGTSVG